MAIASPGKNWGYCSDECVDVKDPFTYNVAYSGLGLMAYLPQEKCAELLGDVSTYSIESVFLAPYLKILNIGLYRF